jgi:molybdopterin converting factor small subunit
VVRIKVQYFELVRRHVDVPDEEVSLRGGDTVRDLMVALTRRHGPGLADALIGPDGGPLPNAVILLGNGNILHRQGMDTELTDGGLVRMMLMPPFIGGG